MKTWQPSDGFYIPPFTSEEVDALISLKIKVILRNIGEGLLLDESAIEKIFKGEDDLYEDMAT